MNIRALEHSNTPTTKSKVHDYILAPVQGASLEFCPVIRKKVISFVNFSVLHSHSDSSVFISQPTLHEVRTTVRNVYPHYFIDPTVGGHNFRFRSKDCLVQCCSPDIRYVNSKGTGFYGYLQVWQDEIGHGARVPRYVSNTSYSGGPHKVKGTYRQGPPYYVVHEVTSTTDIDEFYSLVKDLTEDWKEHIEHYQDGPCLMYKDNELVLYDYHDVIEEVLVNEH
ncbi:MAG: hypothetical protein GY861_05860 [bacterium]|nr:hypothetical protein [bacterium]